MLMASQLIGFGDRIGVQTLLDNATGTNVGSAFTQGGLASVFDGSTNQALNSGGRLSPQPAWAGKYFNGSPKLWSGFTLYSPNNGLICGNTGGHVGTWEFYVKTTGQSASDTDGTLIATGTWNEPSTFSSPYTVSAKTGFNPQLGESCFVRVRFISNTGDDVNLAEVQLFHDL